MSKKSRHYRDESDPLLGYYSQNIAATSSVRAKNPLYGAPQVPLNDESGHSSKQNGAGGPRISPLKSSLQKITGSFSYDDSSEHGHARPGSEYSRLGDDDVQKLQKEKTKIGYRVHRVSYTAQNHVQVLFQMYGSAFPQVLPFCVANFAWTLVVFGLKRKEIVDLTFHSSVGHSFMGLLVSFLIVSRSKISYDRFMDFRKHLATQYRACREIAQFTSIYTFETQTEKAREWRQEVCYRTILLLRITMDALLWSSTERAKWEEEYFKYRHDEGDDDHDISEHFFRIRKLSHGRRSMIDENFRAPISLAHVLRQTIMQHPTYLGYKMPVNEYRDLLNFVTIFNDAFHHFRVLVFTPYPFPLVQMTRAFLFFWVYTLPLVLLKDYRIESSLLIAVLVSFGFIGIEYVSMALDDPFGDETNDVDEHGMALLVFEDIYLTLYRTDGPAAAFKLRERVIARYKQGRGLDCYRDDLKSFHFWEHQNQFTQQNQQREEQNDNFAVWLGGDGIP